MLAASADADAKAASAAQKAADASQAMQVTLAAVRRTHADLTEYQERHERALDILKMKALGDLVR